MKNEYRIVSDSYNGYEVQIKRWWFPIWWQIGINTFHSMELAVMFAEHHAKEHGALKYLGKLPKD